MDTSVMSSPGYICICIVFFFAMYCLRCEFPVQCLPLQLLPHPICSPAQNIFRLLLPSKPRRSLIQPGFCITITASIVLLSKAEKVVLLLERGGACQARKDIYQIVHFHQYFPPNRIWITLACPNVDAIAHFSEKLEHGGGFIICQTLMHIVLSLIHI